MKNTRLLVIEDEFLIGMDIVSTLEEAGFDCVEHVSTESQALERLQAALWDAVVADANLNGRSIEKVAALLNDKAIPFIILTGYHRQSLPAAVGSAPVLGKPYSPQKLVAMVTSLCATSEEHTP